MLKIQSGIKIEINRTIELENKQKIGMVYIMNYGKGSKPSRYYFDIISKDMKTLE